MSISELAKNWSGKNGRDFFKTARQEINDWEQCEAIEKELRAEAKVPRAKLKEADDYYNRINEYIAWRAIDGSLTEEKLQELAKEREDNRVVARQQFSDLYDIKEAIKEVRNFLC